MKKLIWVTPGIVIGLMLLNIFFGCSREEQQSFSSTHDLLYDLRVNLQEANQTISFGMEAHPETYLLRGWSFPEAEHTWANARESSLMFYTYNVKNDLKATFTAWTLPAPDNSPQVTKLKLNGRNVGKLVIPSEPKSQFTFTLPASALRSGRNILEFRFAYTTKPRKRTLSAAFQQISFNTGRMLQNAKDTGLVQHGDSAFGYFVHLPRHFEIDIQYQNLTKASAFIEIIGDHGKKTVLKLSPKKKGFRKTLTLKKDGVYNLRFISNGTPDTYTVWNAINLNTPEPEQAAISEEQGFSKQSKPDILLYVVDTLRADHLGCYGYQRNTSPNIDKFASENTLFTQAYATSSWTRASGASILTGLLPKNHKTINDPL